MRLCLVISTMLLAACGPETGAVPAELLLPPTGYVGPKPTTEGQLVAAVIADKKALGQCVLQLESVREILSGE